MAGETSKKDADKTAETAIATYSPPPLFTTDIKKEDYIKTAKDARLFVHANDKPFVPLGYNHNADWDGFIQCNPSWEHYDPKVTEAFFKKLKVAGVNTVRVMIETPASGCLEKPIGTINPKHVRWIDHLVTFARRNDIKIIMIPWDTFWMHHRWDLCPYSSDLGGPVQQRIDFLTKREVIEAQKKRLKYMIDRWGNLGTVFAWEIMNEIDMWWGASPEQMNAWTDEMIAYVREYERKKWGRNHMISVSTAHPMPGGVLGDLAYRRSWLDYASTHLYIGASRAPREAIGPAITENEGVSFSISAIKDNRPYFDSENGPIDDWIEDAKFDDEVFHNMSWSHLASGGAGSGFRWPYCNPHHIRDGMLTYLSHMRKFVDQVPWSKVCKTGGKAPSVAAPEGWVAYATGSPEAAVVWAVKKPEEKGGAELSLTWLVDSTDVSYRTFDTKTGKWIGRVDDELKQGKLSIELPEDRESVAVVLEVKKN